VKIRTLVEFRQFMVSHSQKTVAIVQSTSYHAVAVGLVYSF